MASVSVSYSHRYQSKKINERVSQAVVLGLLLIFAIPFIFPLIWLVSTALKSSTQIYVSPPIWIPNPLRFQNFIDAWRVAPFERFLVNTMITTFIPMAGEIFISAMVAYSFSRVRWPGRDKIFSICLAVMILPSIVTFIPTFVMFSQLGWVNTFLPFVVPSLFGSAYYVFLLRQFMMTLPEGLEEAAKIDGASTFQTFIQIILPLLKPALATVAIFAFMSHWTDFFGPMIYLQKTNLKTLMLGLASFESMMSGAGGSSIGGGFVTSKLHLLMAITLLIDLPCVLLFVLFQRYFIRDIVMSGFKL
jgi:ABC-type glycerol-3-phosphate transport system permease component